MITHRCEGSLKARFSIRYEVSPWHHDGSQWRLSKYVDDWDYDAKYMESVAVIEYCPFCGKRLEAK